MMKIQRFRKVCIGIKDSGAVILPDPLPILAYSAWQH